LEQTVTYNFPENSVGPFNIESDNNLFVSANGLSNLAKDISDFSMEKLSKNIPMGYKTIVICKRLQVWENGKLLKKWGYNNPNNGSKFCALSNTSYEFHRLDWDSKIKTETIYKPNSMDPSLESSTWDNIAQCSESAKEHSERHNCAVIVSEIIDSISWH
jgi:hypothetical protein